MYAICITILICSMYCVTTYTIYMMYIVCVLYLAIGPPWIYILMCFSFVDGMGAGILRVEPFFFNSTPMGMGAWISAERALFKIWENTVKNGENTVKMGRW